VWGGGQEVVVGGLDAGCRVLGPFEVEVAGRVVDVGGPRLRALLAVLVANAGRVVSVAALVDGLWGPDPPADADRTVRTYVSLLRKALSPVPAAVPGEGVIVTRRPGYVLRLDPDTVDAVRFERLAAAGRGALGAGQPAVAAERLAAALGLWRGEAYGEFAGYAALRVEAARLEQVRLAALVDRIEADLAAGVDGGLAAELEALTVRYPGDERLWGQLMTALYRAGRQTDALAAYRRAREAIIAESGVEPTPALTGIHRQVLAQDSRLLAPRPAAAADGRGAVRPAQLPAGVAGFIGRAVELDRLTATLAAAAGQPTAVVISAVSGTAGVGKTALAVHWAHRVRDRFPDGQLYVNLRGFDPGGQVVEAAAAAVRGFLDALGVPPERVPAGFEAQVGLYRSVLAGRRVLVVIDNARDAEHARPLLPGTGTALAVVTSRSLLTDLVADGAHPLVLDLLTEAEARELLECRLGPDRVAAEPDAAGRIVGMCARLPLALALVAARAATHPSFRLAAVAAELAAAGQAPLPDDSDGVIGRVRAVFSWSYTTLTPAAARLFRLLGLHPGPDTNAPAAASLTGLPLPQLRPLLAELARAGLLAEAAPGRYGFHDLLRAYATHLTHTVDTEDEREAATVRLLDHYTHTAHTADRHLDPASDPIPVPLAPPAPGVVPEQPADQQAAIEWLDAERPVLLATQQLAAGAGRDTHAWQLAWALHTVLSRRGRWQEWAGAWQTALPAAGRLPHPAAAAAHRSLGWAVARLGDDEQADAHLQHALQLHAEAADPVGQAHTHHALGNLWERRGRPDRALDHAGHALTLFQSAGDRHGQAHALNAVGWYRALLGDHTHALTYCQQALALFQQLGDRYGEANAWDSLGYGHHHLNHHAQATDCYQHALTLYGDLGDRYYEAETLTHIGDTQHAAGDRTAAGAAWRQALAILTDLNHPETDTVRAKLATLDHTPPSEPGTKPSPA
jgi:DNA-binding SARP family transcriptional activator/tetratricopeptide (TPR) repeat protein